MELFQILRVVAPRNPDLQITLRTVLFMEMFNRPLIMSGSFELRIIRQSILYGASDYSLRIDGTVGLGYQ